MNTNLNKHSASCDKEHMLLDEPVSAPIGMKPPQARDWLRQLSRAFEQSPVSIVITDRSGRIEHVNPKFCKVTGYSEDEVLGKNPRILKSGEMSPENYRQLWATILSGKEWRGEFHNRKKNGELYWESAAISPICNDAGEITHFMAIKEDITARKETERQLAEALDFNWTIISGVPVGIVVFKASGQCVMANDAAAELTQGTVPQMLKQNFRQLDSWRSSGLLETAEKTLATQSPQKGEFHLLSTFGADVWLMCRFCSFRRNEEPHLLLAMTDITARKRAEKVMQMFQFATDQAAEAVFWFDRNGKIYYVNERACDSLGYTREELMQMSLFDIDPAYSREEWDESWRKFESKQASIRRVESIHRRKAGVDFPVEVTAKHFSMEGVDLRISFVRDITERRQADEKNRQQALLLDEATDAILGLDVNQQINYWNKGAERIYGWNAAEAIGRNPVDLLHKGAMTPKLRECIQAVKERGAWSGELEEYTREGKMVTIQGRCNSIKDEHGQMKSLLIINTDITEKKKLETQFLRSQRMESIGTLAGGIAHDLNNILTPLLFSVYLLRDKYPDDEGQKLLNTLEVSAQRGIKLVKQVLAFGRGVEGERVPVRLDLLVREIEHIVHETFPKSVEFEAGCPKTVWNVKGDATQLHQVLLNLCVNARDAMPNGGKLSIHIENVELDEIYARQNLEARPGPYVVLKVTDSGTGIPKHVMDRIFEPFFTTKELNKGTGLGLSTCLGIVKSHGGFINCYSEAGKGSAFKVYLPASKAPQEEEHSESNQTKPPSGNNELVLVVDDEKAIREVARKTLERFGYRAVTASNGAEAVALYQQQQDEIAVVVIDTAMPVMDGHAAIVALKGINPEVKIISASGLGGSGGAKEEPNFRNRYFLPKPYSGETLLNTLHAVLTNKPKT